MSPGRRGICSACTSADADAIDADLSRGGWTLRNLSSRWGISKSALHNHKQKHLRARLKRAAEERLEAGGASILDRLAAENVKAEESLTKLKEFVTGAFARAHNQGEMSAAVSALGELRRLTMGWLKERREQLRFEAELLGQLRDGGTTVNVTNVAIDEATAERMARVYLEAREVPAPLDRGGAFSPSVSIPAEVVEKPAVPEDETEEK